MLRRRRPPKNEAIHFSFDSFLDLVTNVVGIIIRLILVTWVGARSYHASMQWVEPETPTAPGATSASAPAAPAPAAPAPAAPVPAAPATSTEPLPPPRMTDDPLYSSLESARREIEEARARLTAQIKDLKILEEKTQQTRAQSVSLTSQRTRLETELKTLATARTERGTPVQQASLSVEEVRQRTRKLMEEIQSQQAQSTTRKQLKYHAPVSRTVHNDEIFFECKDGRVTLIDLPAFMLEIQQAREKAHLELRTQWKVERTTSPIGPYRLRFLMERERSALDPGAVPSGDYYRSFLTAWTLEPLTSDRGETLQKALAAKSEFRQTVDALDGSLTVVTFWVYPDSFELFRQLRDYLYERGLDVAGRPLPPGVPIAASKDGTASRGQ